MARIGWSLLAVTLFQFVPLVAADPPEERDDRANALKVQMAHLRAKTYLKDREPAKAVETLEDQLIHIKGNPEYLLLLRDAYKAYIPLLTAQQPDHINKYRNRLKIIEDGLPQETVARPMVLEQVAAGPIVLPKEPSDKLSPPPSPLGPITPRGSMPAEDPFHAKFEAKTSDTRRQAAQGLLTKAEAAFTQKNYLEARALYEQAYQSDASSIETARGKWAYAKLFYVTEQTKKQPLQGVSWAELESEVKSAMALAPHLEKTGQYVLEELQKRRGGGQAAAVQAVTQVKHLARNPQGWEVAETTSFRVFHKQTQDYAEKVAKIAEQTRLDMSRKWFGHDGETWTNKCDIFLHTTGQDYSRATSVPATSPGHSRTETDPSSQRIVSRQVHLRCDNPTLLTAVLPHETTHVIIAGQYGPQPVPRWADEGIAVLTEPAEKIEQHRRNLQNHAQKRELFHVQELLQLQDYPQPARIGTFYAQSVSVVDYLCKQRGPQAFTAFLRDGMREGYESALRKHYNFRNFTEFHERWYQHVMGEANPTVAGFGGR